MKTMNREIMGDILPFPFNFFFKNKNSEKQTRIGKGKQFPDRKSLYRMLYTPLSSRTLCYYDPRTRSIICSDYLMTFCSEITI